MDGISVALMYVLCEFLYFISVLQFCLPRIMYSEMYSVFTTIREDVVYHP